MFKNNNKIKNVFVVVEGTIGIEFILKELRKKELGYIYSKEKIVDIETIVSSKNYRTIIGMNNPELVNIICIGVTGLYNKTNDRLNVFPIYNDVFDREVKNPVNYWKRSIIGRVFKYIGSKPSMLARAAAASDYCLEAAYLGLCPNLNMKVFNRYRLAKLTEELSTCNVGYTKEKLNNEIRKISLINVTTIGKRQKMSYKDITDGKISLVNEAAVCSHTAVSYTTINNGILTKHLINATPLEIDIWVANALPSDVVTTIDYYNKTAIGITEQVISKKEVGQSEVFA